MRGSKWFFYAVIGGAAIISISCGAPPRIIRQASAPLRPEWINHPPEEKNKVFFIGICSGADSLESGQDAAAKNAASKIAQYIDSEIQSEYHEHTTEIEQSLMRQISAHSSAQLSEFHTVDWYYEKITRLDKNFSLEKYDVYVLTSYSHEAAQQERDRQEKEKKAKVLSAVERYRETEKAIDQHNYWLAIRTYKKIIRQVADINGSFATHDALIGDVFSLRSLTQEKLKEAVTGWRRFNLSLNFIGSPDTEATFRSALLGALSDKGFLIEERAPSLQLSGNVVMVRGGMVLGSRVYSTQGNMSFARLSDRKIIATVTVQGKGLHQEPPQAALNAASEAGKSTGEELAKALEKFENQRLED